jgi:hypothetical protein
MEACGVFWLAVSGPENLINGAPLDVPPSGFFLNSMLLSNL